MREYLVRVRHHGETYTATVREVAANATDSHIFTGPEGAGEASTEPAAILAAVVDLRLPEYRPDRRESRYAV